MTTDFATDFATGPVVFRAEFNNFQRINAQQACSLFFTGGKDDTVPFLELMRKWLRF